MSGAKRGGHLYVMLVRDRLFTASTVPDGGRHKTVGAAAKSNVMLHLAAHSDGDGASKPGQDLQAAETGLSVDTVRLTLRALEDGGLITREARYRHGHRLTDVIALQRAAIEALPRAGDMIADQGPTPDEPGRPTPDEPAPTPDEPAPTPDEPGAEVSSEVSIEVGSGEVGREREGRAPSPNGDSADAAPTKPWSCDHCSPYRSSRALAGYGLELSASAVVGLRWRMQAWWPKGWGRGIECVLSRTAVIALYSTAGSEHPDDQAAAAFVDTVAGRYSARMASRDPLQVPWGVLNLVLTELRNRDEAGWPGWLLELTDGDARDEPLRDRLDGVPHVHEILRAPSPAAGGSPA